MIVVVRSDAPELSEAAVRAAVAAEIGAPALSPTEAEGREVRGTVTITYRPSRGELAVTYADVARGTVSRVVPAPRNVADARSTGALMAGNLVRNEADDLLGASTVPAAPGLSGDASAPAGPRQPGASAAAGAMPRATAAGAETTPREAPHVPANAAFFYPLAVNYGKPDARVNLDFALLYGRIGSLEGFQLGLVNSVARDVNGTQVALGGSFVGRRVVGWQLAGGANVVVQDVEGAQTALGVNHAGGNVTGMQIALGLSSTGGSLSGLQLAAINLAGDVRGLQLGAVNVASKVKGAQIGLVNVADDVEGVPIGLVSVTRSGGVHVNGWFSSTSHANVGLKFATRYTYTMLSGSAHFDGMTRGGPGFTVGARVPIEQAFVDIDVGVTWLFGGPTFGVSDTRFLADDVALGKLRVLGGYAFHHHFSVFGGGGVTVDTRFDATTSAPLVRIVPELALGIQL